MKKVYIGMSADVFHHGHATYQQQKYGDVMVGFQR